MTMGPRVITNHEWLARRVWEDDGGRLSPGWALTEPRHGGPHVGGRTTRMRIPACVHSFYEADSGQSWEMKTQLFLDFDPVFPGWPPEASSPPVPT